MQWRKSKANVNRCLIDKAWQIQIIKHGCVEVSVGSAGEKTPKEVEDTACVFENRQVSLLRMSCSQTQITVLNIQVTG